MSVDPPIFDVDACIVDLDGTMVDTLGDFEFALNRMLADLRLGGVGRAQVRDRVGKGSEHLIRSVLALQGQSDAVLLQQAWERYQHHYLAINGQYSALYPGVIEALQAFRAAGLRMACLTNKPTAFALPLLKAKGLDRFFEHSFGGDAFERKKPDPLPLLLTCEALGSLPARTLMLGDSSNDALAARAAGCPVALVRYGYNHGQPVDAVDADAFVDRLDQIRIQPRSGHDARR